MELIQSVLDSNLRVKVQRGALVSQEGNSQFVSDGELPIPAGWSFRVHGVSRDVLISHVPDINPKRSHVNVQGINLVGNKVDDLTRGRLFERVFRVEPNSQMFFSRLEGEEFREETIERSRWITSNSRMGEIDALKLTVRPMRDILRRENE